MDAHEKTALGAELADNVLQHYGVKGMRWGIRNDDSSGRGRIRRGVTKANVALGASAQAVREGEEKLIFLPKEQRIKAARATQSRVLGEAITLNRTKQFKGKDLKNNPGLRDAYNKQLTRIAKGIYEEQLVVARQEAVNDVVQALFDPTGDRIRLQADSRRIRHAENDNVETLMILELERDELGHVIGTKLADDILQHYGVKGMRWGIRRDGLPSAVVTSQTPGKRVKAKGGANQPASTDAINAAVARQKAKASTPDALSNQELQALVNRMNLEQQYARLNEGNTSAGVKLARAFLGDYGKTKFFDYADEAVTGNPEFPNMKPKPQLAPVVKSLKKATKYDQGGKKKK